MQLISVERWTFWTGLATAFFGPIISAVLFPSTLSNGASVSIDWLAVVLILFLVSVALGGSRDPSVRRVPAQLES